MPSPISMIKKIARKTHENDKRFKKFFLFQLGKKSFSIAVEDVIEVLNTPQIMSIPECSELICGALNVRGTIVPIIDIKRKMNLPTIKKPSTDYQLLLMCLSEIEYVGIVVDSIEYRLKNGVLTDAQAKEPENNAIRYAIIDETKYPVFDINNWLNEADIKNLKKVVESF